MVREFALFILIDGEITTQQGPAYKNLYHRPGVSAKSYSHICLYNYFNSPSDHYGHAVCIEGYVVLALCTQCRPMVLD